MENNSQYPGPVQRVLELLKQEESTLQKQLRETRMAISSLKGRLNLSGLVDRDSAFRRRGPYKKRTKKVEKRMKASTSKETGRPAGSMSALVRRTLEGVEKATASQITQTILKQHSTWIIPYEDLLPRVRSVLSKDSRIKITPDKEGLGKSGSHYYRLKYNKNKDVVKPINTSISQRGMTE